MIVRVRAKMSSRMRLLVAIYVELSVTLLVLAWFANADPYFEWALRWELAWQSVSFPGLAAVMHALTWLADDWHPYVVVALVSSALALLNQKITALVVVASVVGGQFFSLYIKIAVHRLRPAEAGVHIMRHPLTLSFPSGYVVHFMAFYGFLLALTFLYMRRGALRILILVVLGILITGIGLSRIYVGEHWPSDVVGGYLVGLCWLGLVVPLEHRWRVRMAARASSVKGTPDGK